LPDSLSGKSHRPKPNQIMGILKNYNFRSISRHAKNLTAGIYLIFRGLNFEQNAEIGRKGNFSRYPYVYKKNISGN
jgi:hypothetical protein